MIDWLINIHDDNNDNDDHDDDNVERPSDQFTDH